MKTYAIPDLHGRFDLLLRAYEAVLVSGPGTIVHLGDYVDRGPDSRKVIEFLMNSASVPAGFNRVILKGNHEKVMNDSLWDRLDPVWWLSTLNGGAATMRSYGHPEIPEIDDAELLKAALAQPIESPILQPGFVPEAHLDWIYDLPLYFADAHRVFVHACVDPELSLPEQNEEVLLWGRYTKTNPGGYRGAHVVHGHDADEEGPLLLAGRTNLDCNAWRTGRLAVGVFDDEKPGGPIDIMEIKI